MDLALGKRRRDELLLPIKKARDCTRLLLLRRRGQPGRQIPRPQVLLLFVDVYVFGVDYAFVFLGFGCWLAFGWRSGCSGCVGLVHDFG